MLQGMMSHVMCADPAAAAAAAPVAAVLLLVEGFCAAAAAADLLLLPTPSALAPHANPQGLTAQ